MCDAVMMVRRVKRRKAWFKDNLISASRIQFFLAIQTMLMLVVECQTS
jgi:hypothetical protein